MSIRSVIMTLVLIALVALLVIGRLHRRSRPPRGVHVRTSALIHRMEKSTRAFDRLERRELARLGRAGNSAPRTDGQGVSPRAG